MRPRSNVPLFTTELFATLTPERAVRSDRLHPMPSVVRSGRVILAAVAVLSVTSLLHVSPARATSRVVPDHVATTRIDTGFRVDRDGFSFPNWGGLAETDALSSSHMRQLLSDAGRCDFDGVDVSCALRNGYVVTRAHLNEHLSAGRCEGMAVLAARIFLKKTRLVHISQLANRTFDLTKDESADEIAYWWATQLAPNVFFYSEQHRNVSVHALAHEIFARMRNKVMVTIGLYTPTFSHTVLPIKAVYRGDHTRFTVYDPNFPGETRDLLLDHATNSWTYWRALGPEGTLVTLAGKGKGSIDYVPVMLRSQLSGWERLGGF